jgi:glucose/arabinose dehydrogenase
MGLPYTTHHAGEIFFGPKDGYLYFMMGDGGNSGDPWNFSQNKKSVLGKALRLDVNKRPSMLYHKLQLKRRLTFYANFILDTIISF